jgi:hypothetical protein
MNERTPAPSSEIESKLEDLYAAIEPEETFSQSLRAQIIERAGHLQNTDVHKRHLHTAWQWAFGLAGLALLVVVIAFSINLLPESQAGPGGGPSAPVVQTVTVAPPTATLVQSASHLPEFPLQVGTTWVYSYIPYEPLPSDPTQIITATYVLTETVMEVKSTPSYFAARVERDRMLVSAPPNWTQTDSSASGSFWYVIQGKLIYEFNQADISGFDPDLSTLAYQLPLSVGEKWCPVQVDLKSPDHPNIQDCSAAGERTVARAMAYETPMGKFDDCYQITEAFNSGGVTRWFCNGVGVVAANYDHSGTRFGFDQKLIDYRAGKTKVSISEAEKMVEAWYASRKPDLNPQTTFPLRELTTDEIWSRMGVQIFQVTGDIFQYETFLVSCGRLQPMGVGIGGVGVASLAVTDLDSDGQPELAYAYSFGSGLHRSRLAIYAPSFKTDKMLDAGIRYEQGDLLLDKIDDQQVQVVVSQSGQARVVIGKIGLMQEGVETRFVLQVRPGLPADILERISEGPGPTPETGLPAPADEQAPTEIAPEACAIPLETLSESERRSFFDSQPQALVGGGRAASGNFDFSLWLVCNSSFSRGLAGGDDYSEIEGLGVLAFWTYRGPDMEGTLTEFSGIEPFVRESSGGGPVSSSYSGALVKGIQFPSGVIPDFSRSDSRLRYLVKVQTQNGGLAGAGLSFTLQPGSGGFQVVDVQVEPLADAELHTLESDPSASPPFPTQDAVGLYPELGELSDLLDRWQAPLLAGPGWLHILNRIEDPAGNQMYGGLTEYYNDSWYQLDEGGLVIAFTNTYRSPDGQVLQQAYARNGEGVNLTMGSQNPFTPYRIDLGSELYDKVFRALRAGQEIDRREITLDGRTAWLYSFGESFSPPVEIDGILTAALRQGEAVDAQTGALLYSEMVRMIPDGAEQLVWRHTNQAVERSPEPPGEVLSLLGQEFKGYEPRPVTGTPAPTGFDASQSLLIMQMVPGDDFDHPSFWYGDIYAGDYLLGRVDFGSVPGGWCDRSADGSRLAFNYEAAPNETMVHAYLRWFELRDLESVHNPTPDLELRSPVAWSPQGTLLAFSACNIENQCGLYVLDTKDDQARLVSAAAWTLWAPVWKPDGTQIGFYVPDEQGSRLYVVDVSSGDVIYPSGDSGVSFTGWEVEMPDGMSGFGRCEKPKNSYNP